MRVIAFGGFLISALTGIGSALSWEQQDAKQNKSHYTKREENETAPQLALIIIKREKPHETNWAKPNCKQPRDHDEADLCQQVEASHAAKDSAFYGFWQTLIAAATLAGLVATVLFARRTTKAAVDSANYGQASAAAAIDAARAAQRQAELAEGTARDVERPYVFLRPISSKPVLIAYTVGTRVGEGLQRNAIEFEYTIENAGRLPATIYKFHIETRVLVVDKGQIVSYLSEKPDYSASEGAPIYEIISPNDPAERRSVTLLVDNLFTNPNWKNIPVIFGFIRYSDHAERSYERGFGFLHGADDKIYPYRYSLYYNYDHKIEDSAHPVPQIAITG